MKFLRQKLVPLLAGIFLICAIGQITAQGNDEVVKKIENIASSLDVVTPKKERKVLGYSKAWGYRNHSIPT